MTLPVWVLDIFKRLPADYTGQVRVNCSGGGVSNVNIEYSVHPSKTEALVAGK